MKLNYTYYAIALFIGYLFILGFYQAFIKNKNISIHQIVKNKWSIWFVSLAIVNIALLIFVISYYYSKKNNARGPLGQKGFPGPEGTPASPCYECNH